MKVVTDRKEQAKIRIKRIVTLAKLLLLLALVVGLSLYIVFFQREFISQFNSLENVRIYLQKYQTASVLAYIGIQVLQIVICIIPGQAMQFAAGYVYAFWFGYLYSIIGAALGTVITFYLARFLGRDALYLIFDEKKVSKFIDRLNSKRAFILVFVIFLIPGLPKDLFTYAAGVSEMKLKVFLIISLVGRTPAMMSSIMIGSMFNKGSYVGIVILALLMTGLFLWGAKNHDKLTKLMDQWYKKLIHL
ncbi:TVP38/TMEM64 family protein [Aminipila butyrica]|uniref:TVP38/TMEM64 family membrane protein n=1 Tax=Aminipila butyrica TaxID=433296 RepID=A0A858BW60_9FIRM|nr:VTT domain-containing protein [Aminipila butyrica]QIB69419.1 TVP38/TMEM64 family protein [Aminipila butyrica]